MVTSIQNSLFRLFSFTTYWFRAQGDLYLHSPFLMKLYRSLHSEIPSQVKKQTEMSEKNNKIIAQLTSILDNPQIFVLGNWEDWAYFKCSESAFKEGAIPKNDCLFLVEMPFWAQNESIFSEISSLFSADILLVVAQIRENRRAFLIWNRIKKNPDFNYTVDFGNYGILIKMNNRSPKQHVFLS